MKLNNYEIDSSRFPNGGSFKMLSCMFSEIVNTCTTIHNNHAVSEGAGFDKWLTVFTSFSLVFPFYSDITLFITYVSFPTLVFKGFYITRWFHLFVHSTVWWLTHYSWPFTFLFKACCVRSELMVYLV